MAHLPGDEAVPGVSPSDPANAQTSECPQLLWCNC